jgi:hypothetical protein
MNSRPAVTKPPTGIAPLTLFPKVHRSKSKPSFASKTRVLA